MTTDKTDSETEILRLLEQYYHYKFMTAGFFKWLNIHKSMNMYDFMQWLKSRDRR